MIRFFVVFTITLSVVLVAMSMFVARSGLTLFDPSMQGTLWGSVAIALYISWRISGILKRRAERNEATERTTGQRPSRFGTVFGGKSNAQLQREARHAERRRRLIEEGKLAPDLEAPPGEAPAPKDEDKPTRVSAAAPIKDRMAARAERVRRAKEEGKL